MRWPEVRGITRLADAGRTLGIAFRERPSDEQMREIHEALRAGNKTSAIDAESRIAQLERDCLTLALRLYAEDESTFAPETREVMVRWKPKCFDALKAPLQDVIRDKLSQS